MMNHYQKLIPLCIFYQTVPLLLFHYYCLEGKGNGNVDLRIRREGDHLGFLVLQIDGAGITLDQVIAQYNQLKTSGNSLDEETCYSQVMPWGTLSFGFKERNPDYLSSIAYDPEY
jgi:hypothetical protein